MAGEFSRRHEALSRKLLTCYTAEEAGQVALLWLEHVTQREWMDWQRQPGQPWEPAWEEPYQAGVEALLAGQPVQYLMGYGYFYGRRFAVGPGVLIPRQETEELFAWALEKMTALPAPRVLDIGTGSGCLAVSLALEAKRRGVKARVVAMDVSEEALSYARRNANGFGAEVRFWKEDIFRADLAGAGPFDVIVSNPPYVTDADRQEMSALVLDHEPELALFAPPEDPLAFYRRIAEGAREALMPGGSLLFEINAGLGAEVVSLMAAAGFEGVSLRKDLQGRDRMVGGLRAGEKSGRG